MDGGEDLHRHVARIDALELLVDLQNAAQLPVEHLARNVRQVEIHAQPVLLDAQPFVGADVEDLARGDVARHQVAVLRIALFEEVVALGFGNACADRADPAACAAPTRGPLRRGRFRSSAAACRRREWPWDAPG